MLESKRCCFTGHRPEKLDMPEREVKKLLETAIKQTVFDGFLTFITGMARGIDMWSGEIVLKLRKKNPDIHLICTPPYEGFERRWDIAEQKLYQKILNEADFIKYICQHYSKQCFQLRNVYMVNHSKRVIAAYNGTSGGTKNTIDYAKKKAVEIINILEKQNKFITN